MVAAVEAAAGSLGISPTRVELSDRRVADTVTLTNTGPESVLVQVRAYAWSDGAEPEALTETHDILAVPAVAEIAPAQRQILRIARRVEAGQGRERAYRLVVSEVPPDTPSGGGVHFAVRLNLPVFVTPKDAAARPRWEATSTSDGVLVQLTNDGTAHLQVRKLTLQGEAGGSATEVQRPAYLLPGESRAWPIADRTGVRRVKVIADTSIGAIELVVPVAPGPRT
jgi:fimbrial chaperone protein